MDHSRSGTWRVLDALDVHYKRGREHIHSPDPDYEAKLAAVERVKAEAHTRPGKIITVTLDEVTFYRQPTLARAYELAGPLQPLAERSYHRNTLTRVIASLDVVTGQVCYRRRSRITTAQIVGFYTDLAQVYADATRIYVVQDNWPIHFHPDVLVALEPQESPWPWPRPPSWPDEPSPHAQRQWGDLHLPIQLVPLPTYASWTNPIEKLWRKLRQDELHLHSHADDLQGLREIVDRFLDQFAHGSDELLRYCGLLVPD